MAKRKYEFYEVVTEFDELDTCYYREALSIFRRSKGAATIYGVDEFGNYSVILSK